MGTKCAHVIADLFLFCYESNFMASLSGDKQVEIVQAFFSVCRFLDDLLNIDNPYLGGMGNQIFTPDYI